MFLERQKLEGLGQREEALHHKPSTFDLDDDDETKILKNVSLQDFVPAATFEREIQQRHIVEFGYKAHFSQPSAVNGLPKELTNDTVAVDSGQWTVDFHTKSQPSFNRQFDLLIKDLKEHENNK